jgi:hypothetical protein
MRLQGGQGRPRLRHVGRDITTLPLHLAAGEEATAGVVATGVVRLSLLRLLAAAHPFRVHAGSPAQPPATLWRCKGAGLSHGRWRRGLAAARVVWTWSSDLSRRRRVDPRRSKETNRLRGRGRSASALLPARVIVVAAPDTR